jgi:metal-responsive CopG/Arc/MetJ family transcriptional regulator
MTEQKLSQKINVLFSRSMANKLDEICREAERPKSNLIRYIVQDWVEKEAVKK